MTLDNKKQIITVDLHNMVKEQAKRYLEQLLNSISINVKEVHIIHGYHSGTTLQNMIQKCVKHPRIKQKIKSFNQGVTILYLK